MPDITDEQLEALRLASLKSGPSSSVHWWVMAKRAQGYFLEGSPLSQGAAREQCAIHLCSKEPADE